MMLDPKELLSYDDMKIKLAIDHQNLEQQISFFELYLENLIDIDPEIQRKELEELRNITTQ